MTRCQVTAPPRPAWPFAVGAAAAVTTSLAQSPPAPCSRGECLATIMDCSGCHTGGEIAGQPDPRLHLAGSSIGFGMPNLGVLYPPNLTPDHETPSAPGARGGIGRAIRMVVRPSGRILAPVMPWHKFAALTDEDAATLAGYRQGLPRVRNATLSLAGATEMPPAPTSPSPHHQATEDQPICA